MPMKIPHMCSERYASGLHGVHAHMARYLCISANEEVTLSMPLLDRTLNLQLTEIHICQLTYDNFVYVGAECGVCN